jgi:hypothetical protein
LRHQSSKSNTATTPTAMRANRGKAPSSSLMVTAPCATHSPEG